MTDKIQEQDNDKSEPAMLVFFDTEFTELGIDPRLISIGLISEDGTNEFYAELSDTYERSDVGDFANLAVLPLLEGGDKLMSMQDLTICLGRWLKSFDCPVKLATDSLSWDWPWIQEIFADLETWPSNLDGKPLILSFQDASHQQKFNLAIEKAFSDGLRRHHSLDDAKANKIGWKSVGDTKFI